MRKIQLGPLNIQRIYMLTVRMLFVYVFSQLSLRSFIYVVIFFSDNPVSPKLLPFTFGDEPSYLGDSTTVQCSSSSGDTPARFSWRFNGRRLC